jgi:hypothetical protein
MTTEIIKSCTGDFWFAGFMLGCVAIGIGLFVLCIWPVVKFFESDFWYDVSGKLPSVDISYETQDKLAVVGKGIGITALIGMGLWLIIGSYRTISCIIELG